MATQTTNLHLAKPDYSDAADIAVINGNMDTIDAVSGSVIQTIVGSTNTTGHTINSGEYFVANGSKYKATASIPNGSAWAGSATAVSENDIINSLNSKLTSYYKAQYQMYRSENAVTANVPFDITDQIDINPNRIRGFAINSAYGGDAYDYGAQIIRTQINTVEVRPTISQSPFIIEFTYLYE